MCKARHRDVLWPWFGPLLICHDTGIDRGLERFEQSELPHIQHITLSFSPDLFRAQIGGNLLLAQEQRVGYTSATRLTQTDHASFIAVVRLLYLEYMSSCLLLYMVPQ